MEERKYPVAIWGEEGKTTKIWLSIATIPSIKRAGWGKESCPKQRRRRKRKNKTKKGGRTYPLISMLKKGEQ